MWRPHVWLKGIWGDTFREVFLLQAVSEAVMS